MNKEKKFSDNILSNGKSKKISYLTRFLNLNVNTYYNKD